MEHRSDRALTGFPVGGAFCFSPAAAGGAPSPRAGSLEPDGLGLLSARPPRGAPTPRGRMPAPRGSGAASPRGIIPSPERPGTPRGAAANALTAASLAAADAGAPSRLAPRVRPAFTPDDLLGLLEAQARSSPISVDLI